MIDFENARCRKSDHPDFFVETDDPNYNEIKKAAKAFCAPCPHRVECAAFGGSWPGIYGGTTKAERDRARYTHTDALISA